MLFWLKQLRFSELFWTSSCFCGSIDEHTQFLPGTHVVLKHSVISDGKTTSWPIQMMANCPVEVAHKHDVPKKTVQDCAADNNWSINKWLGFICLPNWQVKQPAWVHNSQNGTLITIYNLFHEVAAGRKRESRRNEGSNEECRYRFFKMLLSKCQYSVYRTISGTFPRLFTV